MQRRWDDSHHRLEGGRRPWGTEHGCGRTQPCRAGTLRRDGGPVSTGPVSSPNAAGTLKWFSSGLLAPIETADKDGHATSTAGHCWFSRGQMWPQNQSAEPQVRRRGRAPRPSPRSFQTGAGRTEPDERAVSRTWEPHCAATRDDKRGAARSWPCVRSREPQPTSAPLVLTF